MMHQRVLGLYEIGTASDWVLNHSTHAEDGAYVLRLRDLPPEEKPREKLMRYGPDVLSVSELLAIVLGVGTKKEELLAMTSRIVKEYGDKGVTYAVDPQRLSRELGLPIAKSCQIVACFALGRRFFQKIPHGPVTIRTARQAYEYLKPMGSLAKEQLRALYLTSNYQLLHEEVISIGSLTANIVHPREVFKPALICSAAAVILAHNHPSGSTAPSKADVIITRQLVDAAHMIGVELLDHLIITKNRFVRIPVNASST